MSFKDFNDEGPGTFGWDYVLGGNTTGLFPDETHYVLEGDTLTQVKFSHAGGGSMELSEYGPSWEVENISPAGDSLTGSQSFTFEQGGSKFKATINGKYKQREDCLTVDVEEVK